MVSKIIVSNFEKLQQQMISMLNKLDAVAQTQKEILDLLKKLEGSISFLSVLSAKINTNSYEITSQIEEKLNTLSKDIAAERNKIITQTTQQIIDQIQSLRTLIQSTVSETSTAKVKKPSSGTTRPRKKIRKKQSSRD